MVSVGKADRMIILLLVIWIQLIGVNLVFNENKQYVLDKIKGGYLKEEEEEEVNVSSLYRLI